MSFRKFFGLILLLSLIFISNDISFAVERSTYRMVLIGNSDYQSMTVLKGATMDVDRVKEVYEKSFFKDENISPEIYVYKNLTSAEMLEAVSSATENLGENDVLFFYYSGHGKYLEETKQSYLIGVDEVSEQNIDVLSASELENELDSTFCTKVVVIDACESGGFINDDNFELQNNGSDDELKKFNKGIIEPFKKIRRNGVTTDYMNREGYKVMTAAAKDQYSYETYNYGIGYGGQFTANFVKGIGYIRDELFADENNDDIVTQKELYDYIKPKIYSDVQVYPRHSKFEMLGRKVIVEPIGMELKKKYAVMMIGQNDDINLIWQPEWSTGTEIVWSSSDDMVATIDENGKIEAVGEGIAVIKGRAVEKKFEVEKTIEVLGSSTKIFDYRENTVDSTKMWTIEFNQKINIDNLDKIRLIDANGYRVAFELEYGEETSIVKIRPVEKYESGMEYELIIDRGFESNYGNILKNSVWLRFIVEK